MAPKIRTWLVYHKIWFVKFVLPDIPLVTRNFWCMSVVCLKEVALPKSFIESVYV